MTDSHMIENKRKTSWLDILVLAAWLQGGLLYFFPVAVEMVTGSAMFGNILLIGFYIFLILLSFSDLRKKIRFTDFLFPVVLLVIVLVSYLFQIDARPHIDSHLVSLFFTVVPYYFVGVAMNRDKKMFDLLYRGSLVAFLANVLYIALILFSGRELQEDNLFLAYSILPHALMIFWRAFDKKKLYLVLLSIFAFLLVVSLGSRGPVVSMLAFIFFVLLYKAGKNKLRKYLLLLFGIAIFYFVMYSNFWDNFLFWLRDLVENFNISTRVIDAVLMDAAEGSNQSRLKIYGTMLDYIQKRPFVGYGIYGEWAMIDYTAHQIVLELWCHYGVIMGTGVLTAGIATVFRGYRSTDDKLKKMFVLLMVSWGVIRCIYAGSYLSEYIFVLLGFSVALLREKRKSKSEVARW